MVDDSLWIKSRSGNPTIRTCPFQGENIKYVGEYENWYRCFELEHNIIAINEPYHAQGVFAYLIFGSEKTLLLDTGMGICSIKPVVEKFVKNMNDLIVLNTHTHFDHIGSNSYFNEILIPENDVAVRRAETGYLHEEILPEITDDQFYFPYPEGYEHNDFYIPGFNYKTVKNESLIDLGDRILQIIETPGHSADSIVVFDSTNRLLFTGDTYYPGRLFLLNNDSQLEQYVNTMDKLCSYVEKIDRLIPSHNYPQDDPLILYTVRDAMKSLLNGSAPAGRKVPDLGDKFLAYDFKGCTIVMP